MLNDFAVLKSNALSHLAAASEFARRVNRPRVADKLEQEASHLAESRYNIAVVGNMNRGKSTLINTLLGRVNDDLSPIDNRVCTAAIVEYFNKEAHPEKLAEAQIFIRGQAEPLREPIEAVREYITEQHNPDNRKKVSRVNIYGDFPLLHNVVTLVDTPGRGAVQQYHEVLLDEFLPRADAIVFLISADVPIAKSEKDFLKQLRKVELDRVFYVLTKTDAVDKRDLPDVRKWVDQQIKEAGLCCKKLFEVSARSLFEARCEGRDEGTLYHESGVAELEAALEEFIISKSEKNSRLLPRLRSLLDEVDRVAKGVTIEKEHDLSHQSFNDVQIAEEISALEHQATNLRKSCSKAEKKFRSAWAGELAKFRRKFTGRTEAITGRILNDTHQGGILDAVNRAFKLKRVISGALQREIEIVLPDLDERLATVADSLRAEIETDWETYQRSRPSFQLLVPGSAALGLGASGLALKLAAAEVGTAITAFTEFSNSSSWSGFKPILDFIMSGTPFGKGALLATAKTAAFSAATSVAVAAGTVWISKQIISGIQEHRVPELVTETIDQMVTEIETRMAERCEEIVATYKATIEEQISAHQERLCELQQIHESHDPNARHALQRTLDQARQLSSENLKISNSLRLLP
jgi:GTP-binding protein EngB required for normal cell division